MLDVQEELDFEADQIADLLFEIESYKRSVNLQLESL
jgi:hypothetical protein